MGNMFDIASRNIYNGYYNYYCIKKKGADIYKKYMSIHEK